MDIAIALLKTGENGAITSQNPALYIYLQTAALNACFQTIE